MHFLKNSLVIRLPVRAASPANKFYQFLGRADTLQTLENHSRCITLKMRVLTHIINENIRDALRSVVGEKNVLTSVKSLLGQLKTP